MVLLLFRGNILSSPFCQILFILKHQLQPSIISSGLGLLQEPLHKKGSFPLRVSSVNVTKSAVSCGFDHIYWRNPWWKTSFLRIEHLKDFAFIWGKQLQPLVFKGIFSFRRTSGSNFCLKCTVLCSHSFMMNVLLWPE